MCSAVHCPYAKVFSLTQLKTAFWHFHFDLIIHRKLDLRIVTAQKCLTLYLTYTYEVDFTGRYHLVPALQIRDVYCGSRFSIPGPGSKRHKIRIRNRGRQQVTYFLNFFQNLDETLCTLWKGYSLTHSIAVGRCLCFFSMRLRLIYRIR
jgi:hypothetical protein